MRKYWNRRTQILAVVLLAALLRAWAAWQLPVDADEPVYLQAGFDYARLLRAGDLAQVVDYPKNAEHPPLVKLLYGLGVLALGRGADFTAALYASRAVSAAFGVLAVLLLAIIDPLAGLFLALQTTVVKYTAEAYLEALPLFATLLVVTALLFSSSRRDPRLWISALALGLTAAGKYSYFPIAAVLLYLWFWEKRYSWKLLLAYLGVAVVAFLLLDPHLWRDPFNRLLDSAFFHARYSQSAHVRQVGYPWYQPFIWVSRSMPFVWHPDVFFYYGFDGLIAFFALLGLPREWRALPAAGQETGESRRRPQLAGGGRWVVVWIVTGMAFLLLWPTKWPQYSLVVLPACCLAGATGFTWAYRRLRQEDLYWDWLAQMVPKPSRAILGLMAGLVIVLTVGQVYVSVRWALIRRGWWQFDTQNTALPSNTIYNLLPGAGREMVVTGEGGVAFLNISPDTRLVESWQLFTPANSGMAGGRVLAAVQDPAGGYWFGTDGGLNRYANGQWRAFTGANAGLPGAQVQALALSPGGVLWVGADHGLARYDGKSWQAFSSDDGLPDNYVSALAVGQAGGQEVLWVGLRGRLARYTPAADRWELVADPALTLGSGDVSSLLVDSRGRLWVATLGDGLHMWDGSAWQGFHVSDSGIPSNTVVRIVEPAPSEYWVATAKPSEVGGVLSRLALGRPGERPAWYPYTPHNSGFSGAEPLAVARDLDGRLWIGTRTTGIEIYQPPEAR